MNTVAMIGVLSVCLTAGCGSHRSSEDPDSNVASYYPRETRGVSASLRSLGRRKLSRKPLRLEYTLTNTTHAPVVLYRIGNSYTPYIHGDWGSGGTGLTGGGGAASIKLLPGESVSRWIELQKVEPNDDRWAHAIKVHEESGAKHYFSARDRHGSIRFEIGFYDQLFTGPPLDYGDPVMATPCVEILL